VVVGEYQLDTDADLAVSLLQGNDVPAMRVPASGLVASFWAYMSPVQVLVPPDRAEEARELSQGGGNVT
jgi:hypothetical protein